MDKLVRVTSWAGVILFIGAAVCVAAFNIIGSEIDAEGMLHEPFFLIPLSLLFIISSIIAGIVHILARIVRAKQKKTTMSY